MKIKQVRFAEGAGKAAEELAEQIEEWVDQAHSNGSVVGLSGGIDSTTVAYLCKKAFENKYELFGLVMPSSANNPKDAEDGARVAELLGIEYKVIPIEPIAEAFFGEMPEELDGEFNRGNLYSEIRAVVLSRYAASKNLLVMGTGNRDEDYVLGYFTKRGDGAVDNNVLGELPKRLVRELASHLGVPRDLVERVSTAGLWAEQTDEGELGYGYDQAEIIQNGFDQGLVVEEIVEETGFAQKIVEDVAYRHRVTEHKRNAPPVGKVSLELV